MKPLVRLLAKEALVESRGFERLATLVLFAATVLITLQFSVPADSPQRPTVAAGFLWATMLLASILELRRGFETERRDATLDGLRVSPLDPTLIFVARLLSALIVLSLLGVALVILTALFFTGGIAGALAAYLIVIAGLVGLLGWGTLLAAMSTSTRSGELVMPILLFPLVVPQTIAVVRLLSAVFASTPIGSPVTGWVILGAFDLLSVGTSLLLFDYALDE